MTATTAREGNAARLGAIETQCIHAGEPSPRFGDAVSMPIFQSSIFDTAEGLDYHDIPYIRAQ